MKRLSYIQDARCLKANVTFKNDISVYQSKFIFHFMALRNGLLIITELMSFVI